MKVAILPTGRMEWVGLPATLGRLFPDHDFHAVPSPEEIESSPERFPYTSFTSCLLVERHLADNHIQGPIRTRTAQVLRERVSFHLIVPMVEAWLFADRNALVVAGVPAASHVFTEPDLEAFCTNDLSYMNATEAECPTWASKRDRKYRPKWLGASMRERHPKGYIQWLCRNGAAKNCTTYNESKSGGEALGGLMWNEVLARPGSPFRYLRALLYDLRNVGACCDRGPDR